MAYQTLKAFVGDGANTGTTKATLASGDLLILNAADHTAYSSGSGDIVIAGKTDKGLILSTNIKKANIIYADFKVGAATAQKVVKFELGDEVLAASTDYSLGVSIKEDQRMVYNSNAKFVANYKTGTTVASGITEYSYIASSFAKQFALQPALAYGSPSRLVKVDRIDGGSTPAMTTLGTGANATVVQGSRTVTTAATHSAVAGSVISLAGVIYVVDSVESTTSFTIDVPYEGSSAIVNAGTTVANNAGIVTFTGTGGATSGNITFRFTGVAQGRENRYSQNREVDFNIIYPRGFVTSLPAVSTAFAPGYGTYAAIRDIEERAYTNAFPHINYREFPFEDWVFNVDLSAKSTLYNVLTLTYSLNMEHGDFMTGGIPATQHTLVIAAPAVADGQMDSGTAGTFATLFNTWYGSTIISSDPS